MKYSRCLIGFAVILALSTTGDCRKINSDSRNDDQGATISKDSTLSHSQLNPFGSSVTDFSLDFLKNLHELQSTAGTLNKNVIFSPSSIFRAFLSLSFGANGLTKSQLEKALYLNRIDEVNEGYQTWKELNVSGVLEADRLYYDSSIEMKKEIETLLAEDMHKVDMESTSTLEEVNEWVSNMTQKNIPQLLTSPLEDVKLLLLSIVYMKAGWKHKFNENNTEKCDFQATGGKKTVDMMFISTKLKYVRSTSLKSQVVSLEYENSPLSFFVFLPNDDQTVEKLISLLSRAELNKTVESMALTDVDLYLPKFKVEGEIDLIPTLNKSGVHDAFTSEADLSGLTNMKNLYVKKAFHKVVLEVDEEGTTAAAATAVQATFYSVRRPVTFKANHPFVYMIYDRISHMPVFVGVMIDPTQ